MGTLQWFVRLCIVRSFRISFVRFVYRAFVRLRFPYSSFVLIWIYPKFYFKYRWRCYWEWEQVWYCVCEASDRGAGITFNLLNCIASMPMILQYFSVLSTVLSKILHSLITREKNSRTFVFDIQKYL
jgi:hypothetical protein